MTITLRLACMFTLAAFVPACAVIPKPASSSEVLTKPRDGLSARTLTKGECGLFIWTGDASRNFILFTQSQSQEAVWYSPTGEAEMTIVNQSGDVRDQQYPVQSLKSVADTNVQLALNMTRSEIIDGGTRYKGGSLTLKRNQAWDKIIPVIGLSTCQP